jgi:two-component system chemotaxis response regulator CheB
MDLNMPGMDGIETLDAIMKEWPIPVILFSGSTAEDSSRVLEAMNKGAIDFVAKPEGSIEEIAEELAARVKAGALARLHTYERKGASAHTFMPTMKKIVVIATSTGGPPTLERLLSELPKNTPSPILIVQHMPPLFTKSLAERLDGVCAISVKEAVEGEQLEEGTAYIAPGGRHMELHVPPGKKEPVLTMNSDPPELGVRPNANKLFKSVAAHFGERTIGIILTGMGRDGTEGADAIRKVHGTIIAQDEESSIIYGMPKEVAQAGLADEVVSLERMAVALLQLLDL